MKNIRERWIALQVMQLLGQSMVGQCLLGRGECDVLHSRGEYRKDVNLLRRLYSENETFHICVY